MTITEADISRAVYHGGQCGGRYLDRIGKTDLAILSKEEWWRFLQVIFSEYGAELDKVTADKSVLSEADLREALAERAREAQGEIDDEIPF